MQAKTVRSLLDSAARMGELAHARPSQAEEFSKAALDLTQAAINAANMEKLIASCGNADLSVDTESQREEIRGETD